MLWAESLEVLQETRGLEGTKEYQSVGKQTLSALQFEKQHVTYWISSA